MPGRWIVCQAGRVLTFFAPHWLYRIRCPSEESLSASSGIAGVTKQRHLLLRLKHVLCDAAPR